MYIGLNRNSRFPVISDRSIFDPVLAVKPEIRMLDQPNGTQVCCYMVAAEGTFDCPIAREARGAVFKDGKLVGRPLHKFFNVNEREETRVENIDWSRVVRVMDKRDGSMIHTVAVPNTDTAWIAGTGGEYSFDLKSKKSFTSDVAHLAKSYVILGQGSGHHVKIAPLDLCQHVVDLDATAIFELTSPFARIVLPYARDELRLLHVRDNLSGRYWTLEELRDLSKKYGVPLVDEYQDVSIDELLAQVETREGIEGWVLQFDDGEMVKLKTKWYLERHRAMTFLRERDIARLVLQETVDDLKALLVGEKVDIKELLAIEARVLADVREIEVAVDAAWTQDRELSRKDFALKHQGHPYFSLMMQRYSGKDPNVKEWFEKRVLDDRYGLKQLNLIQSIGEPE